MSINENAVKMLCGELGFNSRGEFESKVVEITPEIATELYSFSAGNRSIKSGSLAMLVDSIKSDTFLLTNNSISFDESLCLRDGHHRIKAISIAGRSVKVNVSVNIPSENFRYVDRGVARSTADVIALNTNKSDFSFDVNARTVAIANFIIRLSAVGGYQKNLNSNFVESILRANNDGISFAVEYMSTGERNLCNASIKSAVSAAFYHVNKEKLALFCMILSKGSKSLKKSDSNAAMACREFMLAPEKAMSSLGLSSNSSFTSGRVALMVVQHCIKSFVEGKNITRITMGVSKNKETNALVFSPIIYQPIIPFTAN